MESVIKLDPFNYVPITRTPWGGSAIAHIKERLGTLVPPRIGESWEVSTDAQFVSKCEINGTLSLLTEQLQMRSKYLLGQRVNERFGAHSPLLLKWLHAQDVLSVQLHPTNTNPLLKAGECGKPESWLVLACDEGACLYLGFREGLSQQQIVDYLLNDEPEKCLNKVTPRPFDYIAVPPGCVHAVGPGVLVAEPQLVLPGRSGKTWRISDWRRRYNAQGELDSAGKPRELHTREALDAIDWSLPRGRELESLLVQTIHHGQKFLGNATNPFAVQVYSEVGQFRYEPLFKNQFSLLTVWGGVLRVKNGPVLRAGESAFIAAETAMLEFTCENWESSMPSAAFFALSLEHC